MDYYFLDYVNATLRTVTFHKKQLEALVTNLYTELRWREIGQCMAITGLIITIVYSLSRALIKKWHEMSYARKQEVVLLNTLNVLMITVFFLILKYARGNWSDLFANPFSDLLGDDFRITQDLAMAYYLMDTILFIAGIRAFTTSGMLHHLGFIYCYCCASIDTALQFHFLQIVVFACYEFTNLPYNMLYLLEELELTRTQAYTILQAIFALLFLVCRIGLVTVAYGYSFRLAALYPAKRPTAKTASLLWAGGGYAFFWCLMLYWGQQILKKIVDVVKGVKTTMPTTDQNRKAGQNKKDK